MTTLKRGMFTRLFQASDGQEEVVSTEGYLSKEIPFAIARGSWEITHTLSGYLFSLPGRSYSTLREARAALALLERMSADEPGLWDKVLGETPLTMRLTSNQERVARAWLIKVWAD